MRQGPVVPHLRLCRGRGVAARLQGAWIAMLSICSDPRVIQIRTVPNDDDERAHDVDIPTAWRPSSGSVQRRLDGRRRYMPIPGFTVRTMT